MKSGFRNNNMCFPAGFQELRRDNCGGFHEIQKVTEYIGGELYTGACTVTPKVEGQTLPTKEKVMPDDVSIKAIPFFNVSNTSGGNTVYIGREV